MKNGRDMVSPFFMASPAWWSTTKLKHFNPDRIKLKLKGVVPLMLSTTHMPMKHNLALWSSIF